jgi:formylglycine-generating enzyme required for sulfatase activity
MMKKFTLAASVFLIFLMGCDQAPDKIAETLTPQPITQQSIDQREALKQQYLALSKLTAFTVADWDALISNEKLLESHINEYQTARINKVLMNELTNLNSQQLSELIASLEFEGINLNNNMAMLKQWSKLKKLAISKQVKYQQHLINNQLEKDDFDKIVWLKVIDLEQLEKFRSAENEYTALISSYLQKNKLIDDTLLEKQAAELAQKTFLSIISVAGIPNKVTIKAASKGKASWMNANKSFSELMFSQAQKQFQDAQKQWGRAYDQGLVALALPAMVQVVGGQFTMGDEAGIGDKDERPLKSLSVESFNMSQTEITFSQYDAYATANNKPLPSDEGWGRGERPVINVSWQQAQDFIKWLADKTGKDLRLPKEAEWEYAAKANRPDPFIENKNIGNLANCEGCYRWGNTESTPVGQFQANTFGLYDMHGNVWEWTQDCYEGAPGECQKMSVRGGSWYDLPTQLRSSNRSEAGVDKQSNRIGFRIVEELNATVIAQE